MLWRPYFKSGLGGFIDGVFMIIFQGSGWQWGWWEGRCQIRTRSMLYIRVCWKWPVTCTFLSISHWNYQVNRFFIVQTCYSHGLWCIEAPLTIFM